MTRVFSLARCLDLPVRTGPPGAKEGPQWAEFEAGGVRIFVLGLPERPEPWLDLLAPRASEARRSRAAKYRVPMDALRCLAAEGLLRHALWAAHGLDLDALALRTGPQGKPYLADRDDLHFSLSHAGGWVLCALHDRPVGIDAEVARPGALPAEMFMTADEHRVYARLPPGQAQAYGLRLWTLKESLLKAMGTGLAVDPSGVGLEGLGEARSWVELTARHATLDLAGWVLRELPMPPGVWAALCHG